METPKYKFLKVDVSVWESSRNFFAEAEKLFGRIDHVFINAGVGPTLNFFDHSFDKDTNLLPPNLRTIDVNFIGAIYSLWLASYYLPKNGPETSSAQGSIVLTASASSFQNFRAPDYTAAKHGVLGVMRGLVAQLEGRIRLNAISPSWTETGLVPADPIRALGVDVQSPDAVARSVVFLFADGTRHGDLIYSRGGEYWELNNAEGGLLANTAALLGNSMSEDEVYRKIT